MIDLQQDAATPVRPHVIFLLTDLQPRLQAAMCGSKGRPVRLVVECPVSADQVLRKISVEL